MSRYAKRILAGVILTLASVLAVYAVKQSDWGPLLATPPSRILGDPHARVLIFEYSDFQCPACARLQPAVKNFMTLYHGKIRLAYKYFPLTQIHHNSLPAAHAAECAAQQSQFWPYADQLFDTQPNWAELPDPTTSFMAIAADTHLDASKFTACLNDPATLKPVLQDKEEGQRRQVSATPTFFIGDERLVGTMFANDGARVIENALRNQ